MCNILTIHTSESRFIVNARCPHGTRLLKQTLVHIKLAGTPIEAFGTDALEGRGFGCDARSTIPALHQVTFVDIVLTGSPVKAGRA